MGLVNGGFEGDWTRETWTGVEYGEIFVPAGWVAFWREGGLLNPADPNTTYSRPEMQVINAEPPFLAPPRVYEGSRALKYFSFYRVHDAGLMQTVSVTPGHRYELSGLAHAWYWTTDDEKKIDDPYKSGYWSAGVWNDFANGHDGLSFMLGVDLDGGQDPYAAGVIWCAVQNIYDVFGRLEMEFASGASSSVTVFIRSEALWPFKHCDAYWDRIQLVDLGPVEPEPEPEPEPVDYVVVVNLIPQDTSEAELAVVLQRTYADKQSVVYSADDAARLVAPGLPGSFVRVWNPERWTQGDIEDYLEARGVTDVRLDWFGDSPEPEPEPDPEEPVYTVRSHNFIALHSSFVGAQSFPYLTEALPNAQKFFFAGDAYRAGNVSPLLVSVWRKYVDAIPAKSTAREEAVWYLDQYSYEIEVAAKALGISVYELVKQIGGIESQNEVIGTYTGDAIKRAVEWDCIFAYETWKRYGGELATVLLNVAVGNPHESEVELLLPAARAAADTNGYLGYHAYWAANEAQSYLTTGWKYHAGRWMEWDKVFSAAGVYPRYVSTEGGICYAADGWNFDPGRGWRACGSFSRYLIDITEYNRRVGEWNAEHSNRCVGTTIFCAYQWNWDSFLLGDAEIISLIAWAKGVPTRTVDGRAAQLTLAEQLERYLGDVDYLTPQDRAVLEDRLKQAKRR